ncbi:MAG: YibE/F family protein [Patescibacteria group bacterium]|nr:YibE/F family protein [Patescibacteria group bacterium]
MKYLKLTVFLSFLFVLARFCAIPVQTCFAQDDTDSEQTEIQLPETEYIQGTIIEVLEEKVLEFQGQSQKYQKLKILVTKGSLRDEEIIVENGASPTAQVVSYHKGDNVMISFSKGTDGTDIFYITDYIRTPGIVTLFIFFIIISLIVGSKKGLFSLISMAISFIILFTFVLPQIQMGKDPVLIAILASIIIVPVTFYLSHGFEKKTTVSVFGTFIALVITGILSSIFVNMTHLTGTSSEDAMFLQILEGDQYNLKGLLLAGIIIGTLGVMDDITVSQTAIVYQLHDIKNNLSFSALFKRSIQIGKDHIASMINTLVLVYTGASLPFLLLFINNPRPFSELINFEFITTEIVRTLVGSIGLILAVPITTYLACFFVKRRVAT